MQYKFQPEIHQRSIVEHLPVAGPDFLSVAEQISTIAECEPLHLAIVSGSKQLTYRALMAHAVELSRLFAAHLGNRKGVIAVATSDAFHMIVAALGAWRAGHAYLPIDPLGPSERLKSMLNEAEVKLIATSPECDSQMPRGPWEQVSLCPESSVERRRITPNYSASELRDITPNDLAYVIYTSGSTGQPKGVAITQANLSHLVHWHRRAFEVTAQDRASQFSALTFDASVLEIWPLLAAGATLYIAERSIALSPEKLRDFLVSQGITICFAATPIAERLLALKWPAETRLRYLLTGADALRMFPRHDIPFRLVNNYGPTECTVLATSGIVPAADGTMTFPSIGSTIAGAEIYLLNSELQPVPDGEPGQICIGGDGVAAGYIGRPDLTAQRFIENPFKDGSRLYLTGDLGRKLPSGEYEFCGRLDDQLKLRGYRIEPGEIAGALRRHPAVKEAGVIAIGSDDTKQLVAYIVLNGETTAADLRAHLNHLLPSYMIPDYFTRLAELPMTDNGKTNLKALRAADGQPMEEGDSLAELQNEIEERIGSILSDLLGGRQIGLNDNFFRLGGHSLMAAQLIARIRNSFHIDLPLRIIFDSPSIAALSAIVQKRVLEVITPFSIEAGNGAAPHGSAGSPC